MRQTTLNSKVKLFGVIFLTLLCLLPTAIMAQSASFLDLPKDHWAYSDVDFLVKQGYMEGYPDGKFNGRKVTTRYDMALILARILRRMEDKKSSIETASEEERAALSRLTKEFRDELGLLDVRVDSLERRMVDNENKVRSLENLLPKIKLNGFYRARAQYIIDPDTAERDYAGDRRNITDPGIYALFQQIYLGFKGNPIGDKIETYLELKGQMMGEFSNMVIYNKAGNSAPSAYDNIDDYVKSIRDNQYVTPSRMHITSKAKSMKVRVFSGESASGIDDPMNLLTEDTDVVDPYQGIEVSGAEGGVSYQGALLRTDRNMNDWTNRVEDTTEMVAGRVVWQLPEKFSKDSFAVGTTFAEKIFDYKTRGNSNTVKGIDFNFSSERVGKIQANAEFLSSDAYLTDTADGVKKSLEDNGSRFDMSIQNGGFTGTLKHYDFGRNFRAMMAPVWAYDVGDYDDYYHRDPGDLRVDSGDNYGRSDFEGEKLTRIALNYDFGNKILAFANNLSVEAAYLSKTWETDPNKEKDTDGHSGRKFTFHLVSDFNDNTTFKYDYQKKLDAFAEEQGAHSNNVELSLKVAKNINAKGKIYVMSDPDDIFTDDAGKTYDYAERVGYFEMSSDVNPRVFVKGSVEHQVENANSPKESTRVDYIGEVTYNLTPTTTLIGGIQHVDFENNFTKSNSNIANAILAELKKNFTNKFRGRAFYSRAIIDFKDSLTDSVDRENLYGELIYNVSKDASVRFKFGYDYPDESRWAVSDYDNGRDKIDIHTQKMFIFEARSNF
ncbi:MAG: S-layer homology domain-containing protein [Candidatus Ozemobacteraceae bacterium]